MTSLMVYVSLAVAVLSRTETTVASPTTARGEGCPGYTTRKTENTEPGAFPRARVNWRARVRRSTFPLFSTIS